MVDKAGFFADSYGNLYGNLVATPVGRVTFLKIVDPDARFNKYQCTILFPKDDEAVTKSLKFMTKEVSALINAKFGKPNAPVTKPAILDGDEQTWAGFPGNWYIQANSSKPIEVIGPDEKAFDPGQILPGMKCRLVVSPLAIEKGITWRLRVVQLVEDDGVRLYGGPDPKSLLSQLEDEDENTEEGSDPNTGLPNAISLGTIQKAYPTKAEVKTAIKTSVKNATPFGAAPVSAGKKSAINIL